MTTTASNEGHPAADPAPGPALVARLTLSGRGAEREREALAAWLRGNPVFGRGWPVSAVGPSLARGHMGGGGIDALEIILTGGLSLAQLVFAVLTWRQGRADTGRHGIDVCVACGNTRLEIKDNPKSSEETQRPDGE